MHLILLLGWFFSGSVAIADLGDPGKVAWTTVTFKDGQVHEGLTFVVEAAYDPKDSKMGILLVNNDGARKDVPFVINDKELRVEFDWKKLKDAVVYARVLTNATPTLALTSRYKNRCQPNEVREIPLRDIRSIHWQYKISSSHHKKILKEFSESENFKDCPIASCFIGGDGDCRVTFTPGTLPKDKVKDALELYYQAESGTWEDYHEVETFQAKFQNFPQGAEYNRVKSLIERSHAVMKKIEPTCTTIPESERDDCWWKLSAQIRTEVEASMKPFLEKWQVKLISSDPFRVEDRLLPAIEINEGHR